MDTPDAVNVNVIALLMIPSVQHVQCQISNMLCI